MMEETGWLIEREVEGRPHWLSACGACGTERWTPESLDAIRFARQVDAEAMAMLLLKSGILENPFAVTEHSWL